MKKIENIATLKMKSEHNSTINQHDRLYNILLITIIFLTIITALLTLSWSLEKRKSKNTFPPIHEWDSLSTLSTQTI